jgi:hypothetical protein
MLLPLSTIMAACCMQISYTDTHTLLH